FGFSSSRPPTLLFCSVRRPFVAVDTKYSMPLPFLGAFQPAFGFSSSGWRIPVTVSFDESARLRLPVGHMNKAYHDDIRQVIKRQCLFCRRMLSQHRTKSSPCKSTKMSTRYVTF